MNFARICAAVVAGAIATAGARVPASSPAKSSPSHSEQDWPVYGGTPENNHFSPLKQINRSNVKRLTVAWSFDTGESGGLQTSPIEVDGVLYGLSDRKS